jgi:hypothetical protein
LICRQIKNREERIDDIDKNENFYLNGDEEIIEPIQNNSLTNDQCEIQVTELRNVRVEKLEQCYSYLFLSIFRIR